MNASQRKLRSRLGGYARAAKYDGLTVTQKARDTFRASFEDIVDPDRILPDAERKRRAIAARRAHYIALSLKSAMVRSGKKNAEVKEDTSAIRDAGGAKDEVTIRHNSAA